MEQRKRRLPPLKSLIFLESVVRTGSVTAAADELSITHSAVSKQLTQLEEWFGAPLFSEKRKGMIPTAEIAKVATVLGSAFDQIQDVLDEARTGAAVPINLRVIAPATFAMRWLIPQLPEFHMSGAPVDAMVRPTHTPDKWLEMPFDVAIRRGGNVPSQFATAHLFTETLSLVACSRLVQNGPDVSEKMLHEIGLLDAATRTGELNSWLKVAGFSTSLSKQALRMPHFYIALDAMFAGKGALVVPTFLIRDSLSRGEVVELWPQWRVAGPEYHIFANPACHEIAACDRFINWVKASVSIAFDERVSAADVTKPARNQFRERA